MNKALSPYCPNCIAGTLKIAAAMSTAMYGTDGVIFKFVIVDNAVMNKLAENYIFEMDHTVDEEHSCIRFCTSWSTKAEEVEALVADILAL